MYLNQTLSLRYPLCFEFYVFCCHDKSFFVAWFISTLPKRHPVPKLLPRIDAALDEENPKVALAQLILDAWKLKKDMNNDNNLVV